jgi:multicomponent Na+:H+ antiporter subunit B
VDSRFAIDLLTMVLIATLAIGIIAVDNLLASTMLAGIYSLMMAVIWSNLHALDVGFTEAAVGAGISTILLVGALILTGEESKPSRIDWRGVAVCAAAGLLLVAGTFDMPRFGDPDAPIHHTRVPKYLSQTVGKLPQAPSARYTAEVHHSADTPKSDHSEGHSIHPQDDFGGHVPNTVTALLAAYRGYDTMFETTVIFTAGLSVVILLRRRRKDDDTIEHASGPATLGREDGYRA